MKNEVSKKAKKKIFWITFVLFLVLAITPLFILYRQMGAEVGYWFGSNGTQSTEIGDAKELSEKEKANFNNGNHKEASLIANLDTDGDGLPDYSETGTFFTNPNMADTDGDGFDDKTEIMQGYDPNSNFREKVDLDGDWLKDIWEVERYGTNPKEADTDSDSISDGQEITSGSDPNDAQVARINPDIESYTMSIPKIGVEAPIVWGQTRDENKIYEDLKDGFAHYYNTPLPGSIGDSDFFCHSSPPFGSDGAYDTLCANLDRLERGDEIVISSDTTMLRYVVTSRKNDYDPSDSKIFRKTTGRDSLSIISCWPAGTNNKRIVIRAETISL